MFKNKDEELVISRENWEISREYRKAPFKKRYFELEEYEKAYELDFL